MQIIRIVRKQTNQRDNQRIMPVWVSKLPSNLEKGRLIANFILASIAKDFQLLTVIEDGGFQAMVHSLDLKSNLKDISLTQWLPRLWHDTETEC